MSELSIGVEIDGKEVEMPSMVPTLSTDEINALRHLKIGEEKISESIVRKAAAHARPLLAAGRTAFFEDEEGARGGPAGYLVRRAAVEALRHCCTTLICSETVEEEQTAEAVNMQAAVQAARTMLQAAEEDEDGAVAVFAALGLLSLSRTAAGRQTPCALAVRQLLRQAGAEAQQQQDADADGGALKNFEGPKSYSQVVAAELQQAAAAAAETAGGEDKDEDGSAAEPSAAAAVRPRPALAVHFLELAVRGADGDAEGRDETVLPFATKF